MSGDVPGNGSSYQAGGGYQPAGGGISWKVFLLDIPLLALFLVALWLADRAFGHDLETNIPRLLMCAIGIWASVRTILDPEQIEEVRAGRSPRAYRLYGIAGLTICTVIATLSIHNLLFAPE